METVEEGRIVIVGGGISGLATALALHRKGIESVVLEQSEKLRAAGAAIIMQPNGWRALDHLGIGQKLRKTAVAIRSCREISVQENSEREIPCRNDELRCLKRMDLITALVEDLPPNNLRLGCRVTSLEFDRTTSLPILHLHDGRKLMSEVVIGCDGVNSVVAGKLGIKSANLVSTCVTRGLAEYGGKGHDFGDEFIVWSKHGVQLGMLPITHNSVYWFLTRKLNPQDHLISRDQKLIKETTLRWLEGFPAQAVEIVKNCQETSLHLADLKFIPPLDLFLSAPRKSKVTVAGDAMHAMGPFLAQGGSLSLEDSVVLARSLSEYRSSAAGSHEMTERALVRYVETRKMRVFWVSLHTFLVGTKIGTGWSVVRLFCTFLLKVLFRGHEVGHTLYDCGPL